MALDARGTNGDWVADLVAASRVPGRTPFKHFRDSKGISPMRYLRNTRFARARETLRTARDDESVTVIALSCGISPYGPLLGGVPPPVRREPFGNAEAADTPNYSLTPIFPRTRYGYSPRRFAQPGRIHINRCHPGSLFSDSNSERRGVDAR